MHQSLLLDERQSVEQQRAAERRILAGEWDHFHTLEEQRRERTEKEVKDLLDRKEVLANVSIHILSF